MSNFAESHSLPTYKERKAAKKGGTHFNKWLKADEVVSEVYCDIINGSTDSDVLEKLTKGAYENQKSAIGLRTAQDYLAAARMRLKYDFEAKAEVMREDLYSKLLSVYAEAVQKGDRYNAVQAVQTIMKLTGCAVDKPQTAIQVNGNDIKISFGFNKEEDTNED